MNKRKQSPALFELIGKNKKSQSSDQLALPKWWKSDQQSAQPEEKREQTDQESASTSDSTGSSPQEAPEPQETTTQTSPSREPVRPPSASPPPTAGPNPPMASLDHGRLNLSLTPVTTAVVAGLILLALVASYQLGSMGSSESDQVASKAQDSAADVSKDMGMAANDEVLDVDQQRQTPRNVESAAQNPGGQTAQQASAGGNAGMDSWREGWYYVWMETFDQQHLSNAKRAQQWFSEHGVDTWREKMESGKWRLISRKGFPTKQEAMNYSAYITDLATEYKDEYGADAIYLFKDPLVLKNKG
jgi:hypothetical protein